MVVAGAGGSHRWHRCVRVQAGCGACAQAVQAGMRQSRGNVQAEIEWAGRQCSMQRSQAQEALHVIVVKKLVKL